MKTTFLTVLVVCIATAASAFGQESKPVRYATSDGVQISGDYYPPKGDNAPAVILLHMFLSERSAWTPLIPELHEAGFAVLAIDMRGHGKSVRPTRMNLQARALKRDKGLFNAMYRDVSGAYSYLSHQKEVDLSRLAVVGASVGCSVAMDYARRDKTVDVVICMTPGESYLGVDSVKHVQAMKGQPLLLLSTETERAAADKLASLYPDATVRIVGSSDANAHGTHMFGVIDGIEERIVQFIGKHVGDGGGTKVVGVMGKAYYYQPGSDMHTSMHEATVRWFSSEREATLRGAEPFDPKKHTGSEKHIK